jgi:hypothetical protein
MASGMSAGFPYDVLFDREKTMVRTFVSAFARLCFKVAFGQTSMPELRMQDQLRRAQPQCSIALTITTSPSGA